MHSLTIPLFNLLSFSSATSSVSGSVSECSSESVPSSQTSSVSGSVSECSSESNSSSVTASVSGSVSKSSSEPIGSRCLPDKTSSEFLGGFCPVEVFSSYSCSSELCSSWL